MTKRNFCIMLYNYLYW